MQQTWKPRLLVALALLGIAIYFFYPSLVYFTLDEQAIKEVRQHKDAFQTYLPSWAPKSHIIPGLDLQGGIHMVLGVDLDKAISDKTARAADRLIAFAKEEGIQVNSYKQSGEKPSLQDHVELMFADKNEVPAFKDKVLKKFADFAYVTSSDLKVTLRLEQQLIQSIRNDAVNQTIKTIVNRIDKMGVTEPLIARQGDDKVLIQLPGNDNPELARSMIGRTAQLQFQLCADDTDFIKNLKNLPEGVELEDGRYSRDMSSGKDIYLSFRAEKLETLRNYLADKVPPQYSVKFGKIGIGEGPNALMRTYTLEKKIALSGDDLVDARVSPGSNLNPRPGVSLSFGPTGARIFADLTAANIGKRMAIVLEDMVDSAPVIQSKIPDGNAFISMGGARTNQEMMADANQLALVLKAGALPAPVTFREERTVGPSLGKDSIDQAKVAFSLGSLAIALFMIFYYRLVGFTAVLGVIFDMAFIFAMLSALGATLTLPGVAALLLTIGMAVDANVLINERIREELRQGKMPRSAVKAGYDAAMSAVLDTHITTFIAGLVLWQFGTGPIQNFATMLLIGTVSSMVCAIFISRIFVDMMTSRGQKTLSI
ncbi:MAG: protein translocase subunit SecD [Myxococcales bacterium]|nr:protein translocase subunit SecD [Myxococcales bacterium]USN51066.1 MAG: protein translocase subunit SecD [Myxococcales bacterium]